VADKLADKESGYMPRKRLPSPLNLLSVRAVQTARDGDHSDGGGLLLRVRGDSLTWVLRFTAPNGKRREMGLGTVERSNPRSAGICSGANFEGGGGRW
jgi:hypothetical protein